MGWHPESRFSDIDRPNLYPEQQNRRSKINILNSKIYVSIENGVSKAGFPSGQNIYGQAFDAYFDRLAELDGLLADGRLFLTGESSTETNLRLFPTLYGHDRLCCINVQMGFTV